MAQRKTNAAQAEEWVAFAIHGHALDRLVAASVQSANGDRPAVGPGDDAAIGLVLGILVRQGPRSMKQDLSANQANPVANRGIESFKFVSGTGVEVEGDFGSIFGDGRAHTKRGARGVCSLFAVSLGCKD